FPLLRLEVGDLLSFMVRVDSEQFDVVVKQLGQPIQHNAIMKAIQQEMEQISVKKSLFIFILLGTLCVVLIGFTARSIYLVFQSERELPHVSVEEHATYRLVLITQELDTPFWDKVAAGAKTEAERMGASLEIWGSYGKDQEDFLKELEV